MTSWKLRGVDDRGDFFICAGGGTCQNTTTLFLEYYILSNNSLTNDFKYAILVIQK